MAFIVTKGKFHVALNSVGLLLQGAPDRLGYQQGQAPVYGQRFASGDRDYNDLSQWWYFVQTDWSGGFKNTVSWSDDAKHYYSTNIDTWSESGAIKLTREQYPAGSGGDNDFTYTITSGIEGSVNSTTYKFIGTSDGSDSRPHIWRASTGEDTAFTDISTTTIGTNQNNIAQLSARLGVLWYSTVGNGTTWVVGTYDGTTWTDQSAYIYNAGATISFQPASSRCHTNYLGTQYVFGDSTSSKKYALVKTTAINPAAAGDWSKAFEVTSTEGLPVSCAGYGGNIYYLVNYTGYMELWQYNVAGATNVLIQRFNGTNCGNWSVGDKLMVVLNGKLIITIPDKEVWEMDGTSLTRIFIKDSFKSSGAYLPEIDPYLNYGCVIQDNKCWWGNMMYDGTGFHNTWKNDADSSSNKVYPVFADTTSRIWETHTGDESVIWSVGLNNTVYKGDADKNFIVLSNFDKIAGVEKLAYSMTLLFKPFASGQKIVAEYLVSEFSPTATWTTLGTASYSIDGSSVSSKTFFFPAATVFNKIWFRIKLEGGGTNTPTLNDVVMEYLPVPTYKKNWSLNINAADSVKRLDGALAETTGRELKSLLEQSWWTKSTLDFQDLDYTTTTLSDNPLTSSATTITVPTTRDFPEQGRLRCEDEEMFYTGKTPTTFTGVTRGARGTRAVSHAQGTVINNAYKVIITELQTRVPIAMNDKELEYTVGINLREV